MSGHIVKDGHFSQDKVSARVGVFETIDVSTITGLTSSLPISDTDIVVDTITVNNTSIFNGAVTINDNLDVNGSIEVDDLHVTNNTTIDGDLVANTITSLTTLNGGSGGVTGAWTVGTNLTVQGFLSVVTGPVTLGGTTTATTLNATTVHVSGTTTTADLVVSGTTTIGTLALTNLTASGTVTGNSLVGNGLTVNGAATVTGALQANTITGVTSITTPTLSATNVGAQNIVAPGTITMAGTVMLGATTATSLAASGPVSGTSGTFGTLTANGLATFNAGAAVAAGQSLSITNASIGGTGTAAISIQGNITTTAGTVTAPIASLPAIINVSTINGAPYPPPAGGLPSDATFNNLTVNTAFVSQGTATFNNGLSVPTGTLNVSNNAQISGTLTVGAVTASGTVSAATVTASTNMSCDSLAVTTTASIPAITGVNTINGAPYPPAGGSSGSGSFGAPVQIANGQAWPTLTLPTGGNGRFIIAPATLTGVASNALSSGDVDQDYLNTAPRITGIGGPGAATAVDVEVANGTQFIIAIPSTSFTHSNDSSGQALYPGCIVRFTRNTTLTPWIATTTPLVWKSFNVHSSAPSFAQIPATMFSTSPANFYAFDRAQIQYELVGTSYTNTGHLGLGFRGRIVTWMYPGASWVASGVNTIFMDLPFGTTSGSYPDTPAAGSKGFRPPNGYMPDVRCARFGTPTSPTLKPIQEVVVGRAQFYRSATSAYAIDPDFAVRIASSALSQLRIGGSNYTFNVGGDFCIDFEMTLPSYAYRASF